MRWVRVALVALALAAGAVAVESAVAPAPARAVTYYGGGPICSWPLNWSERHWSSYYGVWFQYHYSGAGYRFYWVTDYWGTWGDWWARPIGCGA